MDKKIQYRPVRGFILAIPSGDETSSSFTISDSNKTLNKAQCISVGEDTFFDHIDKVFPCPVKVGDIFLHSTIGHENIRIDGKSYILIPFDRVLAVKVK